MSNEVATFNPVSLMPSSQEGKYKMAQVLSQSGLLPSGLDTPQKVFVALEWGHELQLSPMVAVNNIAVINGKPTLSADIMAAVVKRSPEYGGIEWVKQTEQEAECKVKRILPNGQTEESTSRFTWQDAVKAGLANRDVWKKYPRRMLKHRCQSYALRDMFPDLLAGIYTPEEMESVKEEAKEPEVINVTPEPVENEKPVEKVIAPEPKPEAKAETEEPSEAYLALEQVLNEHGIDLRNKGAKVQPFTLAKNCLDNPESTDLDYLAMYKRCAEFLAKKGIQV